MIDREKLKEILKKSAENEFAYPTECSMYECIAAMLRHIGDPEPELRDVLICSAFYVWLGDKKYGIGEELRTILHVLVDGEHLFKGIGENGTDSVFARTFSVLIVGLILNRHQETPFLAEEEFLETKNHVLRYYMEEKDLRGHMEDKGWAHGAAHGADAIDQLAGCKELDAHMVMESLTALRLMLHNGETVFCHEEDERMARPVYRMIKHGKLGETEFERWMEQLCSCEHTVWDMKRYKSRINSKNFIRCLYFRLQHFGVGEGFKKILVEGEKRLNRYATLDKEI